MPTLEQQTWSELQQTPFYMVYDYNPESGYDNAIYVLSMFTKHFSQS